MWFKNKRTGLKWEVVNEEVIKRLSKDDNYEVVEEVKVEENKEIKKSTTKKK